jgi:hypothetical protein
VLTLLAGATLAIVSALAPLGRIDDPARTRVANPAFWNGATLATAAVVAALRSRVDGPGPDRHLSPEIEAAVDFVRSGSAVAAADAALAEPLR